MGGVAAEQTSQSMVMLRKGGTKDEYRKNGGPRTWAGTNAVANANCD